MITALPLPASIAAQPMSRGERRRIIKQMTREMERRRPPDGLHERQLLAFLSHATEILYGGAAGGGKSHLMRKLAQWLCKRVPGIQIYIFRRLYPDLWSNHMEGPSGFPVLLHDDIVAEDCKINYNDNEIEWANGSKIFLRHCQYEKSVYSYQGAEIHVLMIDELTQFSAKMYRFLRSRVRLGGLKVPLALAGMLPKIFCGANPGGPGHTFVKGGWIDIAPAMAITQMPPEEGGMRRQFIPARLEDNPTLTTNDPEYVNRLLGLGDPSLVRAMREGDWDIVAGGMFDDLWKRSFHAIKPFAIPITWRVDRSFDWGSSHPFSVGWWAESDGTTAPNGITYPRGTLFRIYEWYGWNGRPNEGSKMLAVDIAKGIVKRESDWKLRVQPGPADSSIFDTENGMCIADDMKKAGVTWVRADKSPGSRKNGWERLRMLMANATKTPREGPGIYVFEHCTQFIRTIPVLPRDDVKTDDVDTDAEDHIADEVRYRVSAPKPHSTSITEFSIG